jgi:hypothetical protein
MPLSAMYIQSSEEGMTSLEGRDYEERKSTVMWVLDAIFMDRRFDDTIGFARFLADIIESKNGLSDIREEDSEWVLYYRRLGVPKDEYGPENWPEGMEFCAGFIEDWVGPQYSYAFMTKDEFYVCLRKAIQVFVEQHPDERVLVEPVIIILNAISGQVVGRQKELRRKFRDAVRFTSGNAQLRLILSSIFKQRQFGQFACLLTDGHAVNCMRGEPGWELKRCELKENYPNWVGFCKFVKGPVFCVYVDPEKFYLDYHRSIRHKNAISGDWFYDEIKESLCDFLEDNPSEIAAAQPVIAILEAHGISLELPK